MKKKIWFILFFIIVFAGGLLYTAPAHLIGRFIPANQLYSLGGYEGRLLNGSANELSFSGQSFGELEWKLKPLSLLLLKVDSTFRLKGSQNDVSGKAAVGLSKQLMLKELNGFVEINALPMSRDIPVELAGVLRFTEVQLGLSNDQMIDSADGNVDWQPASIVEPPYDLGKISMNLSGNNGDITGQLSAVDSPVTLGGSVNLKGENYSANINIGAHTETPPDIRNMLPLFGRPGLDGSVAVRANGKIIR